MRALVIGGGIGGLAAAIALQKIGIEADVFERTPSLATGGSGLVLFPHALRALLSLGADRPLVAPGGPIRVFEGRNWQGKTLVRQAFDRYAEPGQPPSVCLHRAALLAALAAALGGRHVRYGMRCTGYALEGDQVTARFEGGDVDTGDFLVGADGIRSAVRAQLLQDGPPRYAGYTCWRGASTSPSTRWERTLPHGGGKP